MLRIKQLPTFDSTAAGKKNVVDLTLGLRYHVVWLEVGNDDDAANTLSQTAAKSRFRSKGQAQKGSTPHGCGTPSRNRSMRQT